MIAFEIKYEYLNAEFAEEKVIVDLKAKDKIVKN